MKQRVLAFEGRSTRPLTTEARGPVRWAAWTPDGDRAILAGDKGTLLAYEGGEFREISSPTSENLRCVAISPKDGVAYACGNEGTLVRVEGGSASMVRVHTRENLRRLAWDRRGGTLLMVGNSGAAYSFSPEGRLVRLPGAETNLRSISWHPTLEMALVTGNCFRDSIGGLTPSPNLFEFRDGSLREVSRLEESHSDLTASSWRPDGSGCLLTGFDQTWHSPTLLSFAGGEAKSIEWRGNNILPTACSWRPDGAYAVIGTSAMTPDEGPSALFKFDGSSVTLLEDLKGFGVSCIAWSAESALIACSRSNRAFTS